MSDWLDEVTNFGYDAVEDSGRRRTPKRVVQAEDRHLKPTDRKILTSTARDARRNFTLARWAIQKHIDFVVEHNFQAQTDNPEFNKQLEEFVEQVSRKDKFDISGRYSRAKYMRIKEASRLVDGDIYSMRVRGGYLQPLESDRIRNPDMMPADNPTAANKWVHGVYVDAQNKPLRYAIHKRQGSQFVEERKVSARRIIPYGFYDRFDQVRGTSPLASAINTMKDLYESFDYTLAKAKVAQLFALTITRDAEFGFNDTDDYNSQSDQRDVSFEKGPQVIDLDSGEDAKFLHADAPGLNSREFWQEMISLTLKSLGIPYSFYDEAHTNFFGSRSALILYLKSVEQWREDVRDFSNDWLCWRLRVAQLRGEFDMPEWFECDQKNWEWIPSGLEYWNPQQELEADIRAIDMGLTTRTEVVKRRTGKDWETKVAAKLAEEDAVIDSLGLVLGSKVIQQGMAEDSGDDKNENKKEDKDE